jgi:hypothetical protein
MTVIFSVQTACSAVYAQSKAPAAGGAVVAMIFIYYCAYTMMYVTTLVLLLPSVPLPFANLLSLFPLGTR